MGQGNVWGLWYDRGTVLKTDTRVGPCFNSGKGGHNETGPPPNTKSYDKDSRKTKTKAK